MKKLKRLSALVLFVMVVTAASLTAMAALPKGGYVPVQAEKYLEKDGQWVKVGTLTASYKKDGRCTAFSSTDSTGRKAGETYTWKGNYITKSVCDYRDSGTLKYKYDKKHKLVSRTMGLNKLTYTWKGKTASAKNGGYEEKLTFNKKGQRTKAVYGTSAYKYSYYKNGNMKNVSSSFSTTKFNSMGEITFFSYSFLKMKADFAYEKDKSGKTQQINVNWTDKNGTHKGKIVCKEWKKVSHVRNCDAAGTATYGSTMTDMLTLGSLFR